MKYFLYLIIFVYSVSYTDLIAQKLSNELPVRGLAIAAPSPSKVDVFVTFIESELAPAHFNLLILRVDYNYAYMSHPELRNPSPLTRKDVKKIVEVCKKYGIDIVPQINLLGHQSWASDLGNLLKIYPQFDETPHIKMPEKYDWPNPDGLYCKSYCPLHPDVHGIVLALMDELLDVFETNLFHAGMDEVFYIGDDRCPRCSGHDKAELFAGEINKIHRHLAKRNGRLFIWGDRLIDGKTTGIGMWEGSMNQTHRAIDLIPKEVFICDWHYERAVPTAVYFAMKGFDVATCPWRKPELAKIQFKDMIRFREHSSPEMSRHFQGIIQTVWSGTDSFLQAYYGKGEEKESDVACIKYIINEFKMMKKL
jgi:hypothetical protein